ncbi:MAG: CarD family transcriptional regulator [Clostridia bacterium]|nr:CarD family transcriptional regulator [Clostridia bacterium]
MYNIGDKVAYPMHGAGIIEAIEEREVLGEVNEYYVLRMPYDDMKVMFPTSGVAADSIRNIIDTEEADRVIEYFKEFFETNTDNWNKRYRENSMHIKSGNIYETAQVVKMLMYRDKSKGLSSGERKMLASAKQIMISEIVLSKGQSQKEIEDILTEIVMSQIEEGA